MSSLVDVRQKHVPNSAKFNRTCSEHKRERMIGGYFDWLPCEILHNIAAMLSVISIIQLKCSSKFWYDILKDPKFVDLHLTRALHESCGFLFTVIHKLDQSKRSCYFGELSGIFDYTTKSRISKIIDYYSTSGNTLKMFKDFAIDDSLPPWDRFRSSGGLMCVYLEQSSRFRVFNPFIGEEVYVSDDPNFTTNYPRTMWFFSYSPSTKEYKILKLGRFTDEINSTSNRFGLSPNWVMRATVCTVGSNGWREIPNVPYWPAGHSVECKGNLFWMKLPNFISFDFDSERFHVIPGPLDLVSEKYDRARSMGKLISMGHTVGYVTSFGQWVLADQIKGIWVSKCDVSIPSLARDVRLIGISWNAGLFGFKKSNFFHYDEECSDFRDLEMKIDGYCSEEPPKIYFVNPHVGSLVSPVRIMKMGNKLPNDG